MENESFKMVKKGLLIAAIGALKLRVDPDDKEPRQFEV